MTAKDTPIDTAPIRCPLCHGRGLPFRNFAAYSLLRCSDCESLFYDPPPDVGGAKTDRPWESPKWYVERGANLLFYAEVASHVHTLLEDRSGPRSRLPCRVLDTGGSYGFLADLGRVVHGWDVIIADPSHCARQGSNDLSIPLINTKVEDTTFETRFDAVIGVQVIEHLHNPFHFVRVLADLLDEKGLLFLTTPDASYADLGPDYHPGEHVVLFSLKGLKIALKNGGLAHCRKDDLSLPQILAVAASAHSSAETDRDHDIFPENPSTTVERYITSRLASKGLPEYLRGGLQFRLFELLVNTGRFDEAVQWGRSLEKTMGRRYWQGAHAFFARMVRKMTAAGDPPTYEASGPGFTAPFLLYRGMLELNHWRRRGEAEFFLALAERLFEHEIGHFGLTQYTPFLDATERAQKIVKGDAS